MTLEQKLAEDFKHLSFGIVDKIRWYMKEARIEVLTSDAQMERIRVKSLNREFDKELEWEPVFKILRSTK